MVIFTYPASSLLHRFLNADPTFTKPVDLLPIDEQQLRLDRARQVRDKIRLFLTGNDWEFTGYQLGALIAMPLATLDHDFVLDDIGALEKQMRMPPYAIR